MLLSCCFLSMKKSYLLTAKSIPDVNNSLTFFTWYERATLGNSLHARSKFWWLIIALTKLMQCVYTAGKIIFSFSKCSEKMIFPKKSHWNMIFLVSLGKMIFPFPENMILFFRPKMKDDLFLKNIWEFDIFFKCSEKIVFPKISHWNMIFLVSSGKMAFLFIENMTSFLGGKWKMIFL